MWSPGLGSFSTDQRSLQMFVIVCTHVAGFMPGKQWLLSHSNQQIFFSSSCFTRGQGQCYLRYQRLGPCQIVSIFTPWDHWIIRLDPSVFWVGEKLQRRRWYDFERNCHLGKIGRSMSIIGSRTRCDMMEWQVFTVIVQLASTCTLIRLDFVVWIGTDPFPALAFNVPPRHDFGSLYGLDPVHNLTQRLRWQCCCCLIQLLMAAAMCVVREGPGVFVSAQGEG